MALSAMAENTLKICPLMLLCGWHMLAQAQAVGFQHLLQLCWSYIHVISIFWTSFDAAMQSSSPLLPSLAIVESAQQLAVPTPRRHHLTKPTFFVLEGAAGKAARA